jgi:GNAT superfamily N-acetyltransferase
MLAQYPRETPLLWRRNFPLADTTLAARLERLAAAAQRSYADAFAARFPELEPVWFEVGGGIAAFLEVGSPVNGTFGLGMAGSVSVADVRALEGFFAEKGERALASICPHAHPSVLRILAARGWTPMAFENVLTLNLTSDTAVAATPVPLPAHIEVRVARTDDELELWAALAANGFAAPEDPNPAELRLSRASADMDGGSAFIGYVDGAPAGTGQLVVDGDIGWLSTDTTLPHLRRRGVQTALQRARLDAARAAGCTLAVTESVPGSASQRNMERLGFSLVYTRVEVLAPSTPKEG